MPTIRRLSLFSCLRGGRGFVASGPQSLHSRSGPLQSVPGHDNIKSDDLLRTPQAKVVPELQEN